MASNMPDDLTQMSHQSEELHMESSNTGNTASGERPQTATARESNMSIQTDAFTNPEIIASQVPATGTKMIRRVTSAMVNGARITTVINFEYMKTYDSESGRVYSDPLKKVLKNWFVTKSYQFHLANVEAEATDGRWTMDTMNIVALDAAMNEKVLKRREKYLDEVIDHVRKYSTFATVSTKGVSAITFYTEDGKRRDFGDLRVFEITVVAKFMKRLSPMMGQNYLFGSKKTLIVIEKIDGEFFCDGTPLSEWNWPEDLAREDAFVLLLDEAPEDEMLVDGISIMAPWIQEEMVSNFEGNEQDGDRREAYAEKFRKSLRFNARFVTSIGTVKGDVITGANAEVMAITDWLRADVITTPDENVKPGLSTQDGTVHFHMFVQDQFHKVRANPQSVAHFFNVLNVDDLLLRTMTRIRKSQAKAVQLGQAVGAVEHYALKEEGGELKSFMEIVKLWLAEEGTLNSSPHLAMLNARQVVKMGDVEEGEEWKLIRQYPASYVVSMSLTAEYIWRKATGDSETELRPGSFILTDYGMIVPDSDFTAVAASLGGADQDDHVEVHVRHAADNNKRWGIKKGITTALLIRNPIGTNSDGELVASEYYVLRVDMEHTQTLETVRNMGDLPEMVLANLPTHMDELDEEYLEECASIQPSKPELGEYNPDMIADMVWDAAKTMGTYGRINLLMTFCRMHNITFKLGLEPEFLIDVCEQHRHPDDIALIREKTAELRAHLISVLGGDDDAPGVAVDPVAFSRIGLGDDVLPAFELGSYSTLVDHYQLEMAKYITAGRKHMAAIRDYWIKSWQGGVNNAVTGLWAPLMLGRSINKSGFSSMAGLRTQKDIELVGTVMADTIRKAESVDGSLIEKFDWALAHVFMSFDGKNQPITLENGRRFTVKSFSRPREVSDIAIYSNTDAVFVSKPMVRRYLSALEVNREERKELLNYVFTVDLSNWDEDLYDFDLNEVYFDEDDDSDFEAL